MPARIVRISPKVATHSANHCCGPGSRFQRSFDEGQANRKGPGDAANDLRRNVERGACVGSSPLRAEGGFFLNIGPLDNSGVLNAPMRRHRMARLDRARLTGGVAKQ
jgi:hypothetical protein